MTDNDILKQLDDEDRAVIIRLINKIRQFSRKGEAAGKDRLSP